MSDKDYNKLLAQMLRATERQLKNIVIYGPFYSTPCFCLSAYFEGVPGVTVKSY